MELDERAKEAARRLGDAINSAIGGSADVSEAIEYLRAIGYEPQLSVKLEIALLRSEDGPGSLETLELTEEDRKTLQRMRISFD